MNTINTCLSRSSRWMFGLLLAGLLLTANCGGGSEQATPIPSGQTTPTSTRMLPIVTPTPNILASPKPTSEQETASPAAVSSGREGDTYVVEAGDTLGSIADKFDITVDALKDANGIDDPNTLTAGQSLTVPVSGN